MNPQEKKSNEIGTMLGGLNGAAKTSQSSDALQDKALANLEHRLAAEKDGRLEDRFIFVMVLVILANAHVLHGMQNWGAPVVIGLLELVALIVIARRCGVQEVERLLDRVTALPVVRNFSEHRRKEAGESKQYQEGSTGLRERHDIRKGGVIDGSREGHGSVSGSVRGNGVER